MNNNAIVTLGLCTSKQGQELIDTWEVLDCPAAFNIVLNTDSNGNANYNPESLPGLGVYVTKLFNSYNNQYTITDDKSNPRYNPFQDTLLDLCLNPTLPGLCQSYLTSECSKYTREQALNSPVLTNFCGCYVPPDPVYIKYTLGNAACNNGDPGCATCTEGQPGCTGQRSCDPICHRALTSQRANPQTGNFITCPQNICAIDNTVIQTANSNVPGGINFFNVCGECNTTAGCLCVIAGVNYSDTSANLGIGTNINQLCGSSSVCVTLNEDGTEASSGPCLNSVEDITIPPMYYGPNIVIVILSILLILAVLILALVSRYANKVVP